MADTVRIQVTHKEVVLGADWQDAQYFTEAEYAAPDIQSRIESEKSRRINQFTFRLQNPPLQEEPTKIQLQDEKAELLKRVAELDSKIVGAK